ncbi:MAG: zinc-ribbon domain-containing protein [Rickettsiales bacterium]|jgi:predicted Zn finger-like uncharacterized protein|nr:zinc-ribbon domain-containing protein [Rickettsiales bacterium]
MIVVCPKCKTEFEVEEGRFTGGEAKFQCAECSFVWVEGRSPAAPLRPHVARPHVPEDAMDRVKLMGALGVGESQPTLRPVWMSVQNLTFMLLGVAFVALVFFAAGMLFDYRGEAEGSSVFERQQQKKPGIDASKLYLEIAKPLTLVREGANEYVMITGFIYNPSSHALPVPKIIIRLENKDERLLQMQEREIEVKTLGPLEKTDFMFKVFKFSDSVVRFVVDFAEEGKI